MFPFAFCSQVRIWQLQWKFDDANVDAPEMSKSAPFRLLKINEFFVDFSREVTFLHSYFFWPIYSSLIPLFWTALFVLVFLYKAKANADPK